MLRSNHKTAKPSLQFWTLTAFLVLVFVTGGSSRADVQSLAILRPASVIICGIACITLGKEQIVQRKWIFGLFAAIFLLAALHVVPLPPAIWQAVPKSAELGRAENLADLGSAWRSLTLAPISGWQSLSSLFTPLAILLLGVQLKRDDLYRLLLVVVALAALSGFIGLLQAIGGPQGSLYFYRITNNGLAVGLFANRNHAATLLACLFPMLAVYASTNNNAADEQRRRPLFAAAIAIVIVPLILVTGSRSGMVAALGGLIGGALLYRRSEKSGKEGKTKKKRIEPIWVLGGLATFSLVFVTFLFSRAEAIDRLFANRPGEDNRFDFWTVSTAAFSQYFPLGSGSGSFVEMYLLAEPMALLNPTYLNRAHNDWLEIAVTFGLPALVLFAVAIALYVLRTFRIWRHMNGSRQSVAFARMAGVVIALIGIASVSDYPLRTPIMMGIFAISVLWFSEAGNDDRRHSSSKQTTGS